MTSMRNEDWYNLNEDETRAKIDELINEYLLSHIKNVSFISYTIENKYLDWKVDITLEVVIHGEAIKIRAGTGTFYLLKPRMDRNVEEELILTIEATREYIFRKLQNDVFRARPYTNKGVVPSWANIIDE